MKNIILLTLALTLACFTSEAKSLDDIKKEIIQQSIDHYPGKCPCPYHKDKRGHNCGRRSAYSRSGGYSVLCFPKDVSEDDVMHYKAKPER